MAATRTVTLVIVGENGDLRGQLPSFTVDTPWWQDLEPVLAVVPQVVILRLLEAEAEPGQVMGGRVTYLAQADPTPSGLQAFTGDERWLADHPLRMAWARPGGPQADLEWAAGHVTFTGRPEQKRSWNLSSIWRIPTTDGPCWLKSVPPFFAHEGAVLQALGGAAAAPRVVAQDRHRMLLAELPGRDGYDASPAEYGEIVETLVALQTGLLGRLDRLAELVPDWRAASLREQIESVIGSRPRSQQQWPALGRLLDTWDQRMAAVANCGLPDVLFHGDAHPGNARIGVHPPIIFDWGDSGIGHPLLDLSVIERYAHEHETVGPRLRRAWLAAWEEAVPGADAGRAWRLLRPVAVARAAVVFQRFLDNIEPSERPYHCEDVEPHLAAANDLLASEVLGA